MADAVSGALRMGWIFPAPCPHFLRWTGIPYSQEPPPMVKSMALEARLPGIGPWFCHVDYHSCVSYQPLCASVFLI